MNHLNPYEIHARTKIEPSVIEALLSGISREDLEVMLEGESGTPRAEVRRMNCIGTVRSHGYMIPKKRGFYQITGYEQKSETPPASQWGGRAREVLDWVETLSRVLPTDADTASYCLRDRPKEYVAHENCWGYLWCYELARDAGWWYGTRLGSCIIIRKFPNAPRFRIYQLNLDPVGLLGVAYRLANASLQAVSIINVTADECLELKSLDSMGYVSRREEAIYSTFLVSRHLPRYLSKKALRQVHLNQRDTFLVQGDGQQEEMVSVVGVWKRFLEDRHRQLAIGRDFVAISSEFPLSFVGYREQEGGRVPSIPVAVNILDLLSNRRDVASDLMNKSLNYSMMPGGRSGTSDWLLHEVCKYLHYRGIEFYAAGGYQGGGVGLEAHKRKYSIQDFKSSTFTTSFPHLMRENIEIS